MVKNYTGLITPLILASLFLVQCSHSDNLSPGVKVQAGAVNGVVVARHGKKLVIYGDPGNNIKNADMLLFTDFRRDVIWAGKDLVKNGSYTLAPEGEKQYFEASDSIWTKYNLTRFHDYYCQTTKFGFLPLKADRYVKGGDIIEWQGVEIRVLDTPGYTRGAVSYIIEVGWKEIRFHRGSYVWRREDI